MYSKRPGFIIYIISMISSLFSNELVLQNGMDGYCGCGDSYLVMNTDKAQGAKAQLVVEGYHCSACIDQRVLIRFDLSAFSPSTKIQKATLSLYNIDQPRPGSSLVNVYTISRPWDEANATWYNANQTETWSKAGGDFTSTRVATYLYGTDVGVWHSVDVTAAVNEFIKNPDKNYGLLLYMQPSMYTVRYVSSNSTEQAHRPILTIESDAGSRVVEKQNMQSKPSVSFSVSGASLVIHSPDLLLLHLSIFTMSGQKVFSENVSGYRTSFDISKVRSGQYMGWLESDKVKLFQEISIKK